MLKLYPLDAAPFSILGAVYALVFLYLVLVVVMMLTPKDRP